MCFEFNLQKSKYESLDFHPITLICWLHCTTFCQYYFLLERLGFWRWIYGKWGKCENWTNILGKVNPFYYLPTNSEVSICYLKYGMVYNYNMKHSTFLKCLCIIPVSLSRNYMDQEYSYPLLLICSHTHYIEPGVYYSISQ